jgi:flagellar biosynthesis protein FlhF
MIIKSFTAETAAAALKLVRREMGGDAIVLKTRQVIGSPDGARVEVTACLEKPSAYQSSEILTSRLDAETLSAGPEAAPGVSVDDAPRAVASSHSSTAPEVSHRLDALEQKLDHVLSTVRTTTGHGEMDGFDAVREHLKDADMSDDLIASIVYGAALNQSAAVDPLEAAREQLVARLAKLMEPDLTFQPGDRVVFVGPAGGGKSTLMGKVAAQLTVQVKQKVTLTTLDKSRMAAAEEVQRYAEVLEAAMVEPSDLEATAEVAADTITLVDTPGLPPTAGGRDELTAAVAALNPTCRVAVFSALMRTTDALVATESLKPLALTHLAVSMTDLTDRIGGVISIAAATGWKIALVGDAPAGIGSVRPPDPDRTARLLLKAEVVGE